MFFTNKGKAYRIKAYRIPEAGRTARGMAIINLLQLDKDEKISAYLPVKEYMDNVFLNYDYKNLVKLKRHLLSAFKNIRKGGLIALTLAEEDELIGVYQTTSEDAILSMYKKRSRYYV